MELKNRSWVGLLTILLTVIFAFPVWAQSNPASGDKAAVVNGAIISRETMEREFDKYTQRYVRQGKEIPPAEIDNAKIELLEKLINVELLYQDSQKKGITVENKTVTDQLAKLKQRFPNEDGFAKALSTMNLTEDGLKSQIARDLAIKQLVDTQIAQKISITEKESKTFYDTNPQFFQKPEQIKARHILIKLDPKADMIQKVQAQEKLKKVQEELKAGKDFAELAKTFSEGPSNVKGGDLGYFSRGQMVKPFEEAAFSLKVGEVSDVVETRFGYHIIKVYDKKPKGTMPYTEVKEKINRHLKQKKINQGIDQHIKILKKGATIEKYYPPANQELHGS